MTIQKSKSNKFEIIPQGYLNFDFCILNFNFER